MKKLRYLFEAGLLHILLFIFGFFSPVTASNIGGWLGRAIGPKLAASRKAIRNLENAMPDLDGDQRSAIITDMWDNLGRLFAEYAHLERIAADFTVIEGLENLKPYIDGERSAIFIGAHLANFEVPPLCAFQQAGLAIDSTYRAPNNPYSHKLLNKIRSLDSYLKAFSKSKSGGRALMKAAKDGANIGILIDQKYNEGVSVPFFGRDAMTNPIFVQLAQKFGHDLVPIRIIREDSCHFRFIIEKPMTFEKDEALETVIKRANETLESWIKDKPGQWLWLHRRWKD